MVLINAKRALLRFDYGRLIHNSITAIGTIKLEPSGKIDHL